MGGGNSKSAVWDNQLPDLTDKVALVTGANSGLGFETAKCLAACGATVVLACRNEDKATKALEELKQGLPAAKVEVLKMDLCSQKSVKSAAAEFKARHAKLHYLFNNAAVMATPFKVTEDGFEEQIAATHLGHFTLTAELLDRLKASAPARVVTTSSMMHIFSGDLPTTVEGLNEKRFCWNIYANVKLANLLFTRELAKRFEKAGLANQGVIAVACHPGYTATNLQKTPAYGPEWFSSAMNAMFAQNVSMGAQPMLYAACGSDIENGDYIGPIGMASGAATKCTTSDRATSDEAAAKLWENTVKMLKCDILS